MSTLPTISIQLIDSEDVFANWMEEGDLTKNPSGIITLKFNNELTEEVIMSNRNRDNQRSKVYKAENAIWSKDGDGDMTIQEIEGLLDEIWENRLIHNEFMPFRHRPQVADGRGCRKARGGADRITMPKWARRRWVVLHEAAHSVHIQGSSPLEAYHGPEFCKIYLRLVEIYMGFEARQKLAASFRKHRVKIAR